MSSLNRAFLLGNLGRDAEMRYTANGTPVVSFSIATTERYKNRDGEQKENTQWHRIVCWGKTGEAIVDYLKKGKQVLVEGRIETRKWTDKDGKERQTTEIVSERITLLGGGGGAGRRGPRDEMDQTREVDDQDQRVPAAAAAGAGAKDDDDSIPF